MRKGIQSWQGWEEMDFWAGITRGNGEDVPGMQPQPRLPDGSELFPRGDHGKGTRVAERSCSPRAGEEDGGEPEEKEVLPCPAWGDV